MALRSVKSFINYCFNKHLLLSNTAVTVVISTAGDGLQQSYELIKKRQSQWDLFRTGGTALVGLIAGPCFHCYFKVLDHFIKGTSLKAACIKLLIDTSLCSPLYIFSYIFFVERWRGSTARNIMENIKIKGYELFKAECAIGVPAQFINFYFVPLKFRVVYESISSVGFDCYYSYVAFSKDGFKKYSVLSGNSKRAATEKNKNC